MLNLIRQTGRDISRMFSKSLLAVLSDKIVVLKEVRDFVIPKRRGATRGNQLVFTLFSGEIYT